MKKLNSSTQKMINSGHLKWKEGEFFVWNVPGMNLPMYTFIDLIHYSKDGTNKIDKTIYAVAEKQAIISADYAIQKFGIKRKQEIVKMVLEQIPLLGFGILNPIKVNLKKNYALFTCKSPFSKYYKILHGKNSQPLDAYLAGVIAGTIERAMERKLVCVENKCIGKGDKICIFELTSPDKVKVGNQKFNFSTKESYEKIKNSIKQEKKIISSPK